MRKDTQGRRGDCHPKETKYLVSDSSQKTRRHQRFSLAHYVVIKFLSIYSN